MPKQLTLILGGARSGKTRHALKLAAERARDVLYVATAEAGDADMAARIAAHRAERPAHWRTLEAPRQVGHAIAQHLAQVAAHESPQVIVLDCVTLLASNVIIPLPEPVSEASAQAALEAEIDALLAAYAAGAAAWLVISNEVGSGIVPAYPLGRVYRDALGRANQRLAEAADEVLLMVAGLPLRLK